MKIPLIGHSHFILFFRPICWLSHPLSPCPQHKEARHGRKASCAARQLQPASASFSSLAVQRVTPTPGTPGLLPEPVLRFPNGTWLWHLPSPRQLPRASTAGRAAQRGRSRPDAGTRGDRVGRGKQGKSQGGGEQPPCPAAGPPRHQRRVSARRRLRRQGRRTTARPRDAAVKPKQGPAPRAATGGS